jgi:hypothetical protein
MEASAALVTMEKSSSRTKANVRFDNSTVFGDSGGDPIICFTKHVTMEVSLFPIAQMEATTADTSASL